MAVIPGFSDARSCGRPLRFRGALHTTIYVCFINIHIPVNHSKQNACKVYYSSSRLARLHYFCLQFILYFKLQSLSNYYQVICSIISEAPSYLCDLLHHCKVDSRLRSDSANKLYQPIARKSVGKRASSSQIVEQFAHRSKHFKCCICFKRRFSNFLN